MNTQPQKEQISQTFGLRHLQERRRGLWESKPCHHTAACKHLTALTEGEGGRAFL